MSTPFGNCLRDFRQRLDLNQSQVAHGVDISPCYYSAIENGRKGPPSEEIIEKLARVLQLTKSEFQSLKVSVDSSKRQYVIPDGAKAHEYELINELWNQLGGLSIEQAQCLQLILKITSGGKNYVTV